MRRLTGRVRSGKGEHAHWMKVYADVYRAETGSDPFPGTLNIELQEAWHMPPTARRFDAGVTILLTPCKVGAIDAFIIRTENNEQGVGDHPPTVVEVISDTPLRDALNLQDGNQVTLILP